MSLLGTLEVDDTIKEDTDSIGGFTVLESGLYPFQIMRAYLTLSAGKAMALNIDFESTKKEKMKAQLYMTSGEAKGCKNFYINKKTKEKCYLPGFNQANSLSLLTTGKQINELTTEKKVINLYDPAMKKEVPTEVDMITDMLNKGVYAGVINQLVDKRALNQSTNQYEPTGETRSENEVDKFFRAKDKLTVVEIKAGITEPVFVNKWLDRWQGKVKDKTTKTGVTPGAPKRQVGAQAPTTSIFA